jgi:hypothetical protein
MRVAPNAEAAAWIPTRLHPFAQDVGSFVPIGFAAYARIFHPPARLAADGTETPVRWKDIAAANARSIEAEMQLLGGCGEPTQRSASGRVLRDQQPAVGSLPRPIAVRLAAILAVHTQTPGACWFAVWGGFADLRAHARTAPVVSLPNRGLCLLQGALEEVGTTFSQFEWHYQSPNLWWPDDKAWCIATEIDFTWSYVGGSVTCIQQVLNDPELEAWPTHPDEGNTMRP